MAPYEALYGRRCRSPIGWFEVGEAGLIRPDLVHQAMEKVSPMKDVMRFGKKGKLMFYISMLKKCMGDLSLIIPTEDIGINGRLSYEEIHVQIIYRQVRRLRTKEVALVKVLWRNQFVEEATWEAEEDMKKRYPHLF
ncbi:hypothetical protein R3W88_022460 [Solanum pinnatisectum]|uniref:Chromo domain-containing protein n=1 Tax=Solanum pinnatisectum TaxID=50273 RepID=A0AAV9LUR0_9SOLN|nr:hypothetical protein R3W88_022460 [Solanum pinnatisectum]